MNEELNMDPKNRDREIEEWLDVALGQYSKVDARAGLESRVLANLRSERSHLAARHSWRWAAGTVAMAVAIVVAVWLGDSTTGPAPTIVRKPTVTHQESAGVSKPLIGAPQRDRRLKEAHRSRVEMQLGRDSAPVKAPRLEQFPSPAPLNEQEQMLARYVEEFPKKAALVARAQADLRQQEEREMAAPWPKNGESANSDRHD
jgi:hypothetical protein